MNGVSMKRTRAYLLMECMIAGAILAIALGTVIGHMARSRMDITRAAFRDVATGLASAKVSELEAQPGARVVTGWTAMTSPGPAYPGFTWRWRLQNADAVETNTLCVGATTLSTDLYSIEAEVEYPVRHASRDDLSDGLADGRATVSVVRVVR